MKYSNEWFFLEDRCHHCEAAHRTPSRIPTNHVMSGCLLCSWYIARNEPQSAWNHLSPHSSLIGPNWARYFSIHSGGFSMW